MLPFDSAQGDDQREWRPLLKPGLSVSIPQATTDWLDSVCLTSSPTTLPLPFADGCVNCLPMYNQTVMDHFKNPRNTGEIENADGVGSVGNPECGDVMKMYIKVTDGRLVEVKHKTFGCAAAIACSSAASEIVTGKTIEEAAALTRADVAEMLDGLPDHKIDCSNLAPDAIRAAIENWRSQL